MFSTNSNDTPVAIARETLIALCDPDAPKVLSKIGLGQAIYALHSALQLADSDPDGLRDEARNICTTFKHIANKFGDRFEQSVCVSQASPLPTSSPQP